MARCGSLWASRTLGSRFALEEGLLEFSFGRTLLFAACAGRTVTASGGYQAELIDHAYSAFCHSWAPAFCGGFWSSYCTTSPTLSNTASPQLVCHFTLCSAIFSQWNGLGMGHEICKPHPSPFRCREFTLHAVSSRPAYHIHLSVHKSARRSVEGPHDGLNLLPTLNQQ